MNRQGILQAIAESEELNGLDVWADPNRPIIEVGEFHKTANWERTKGILEKMGFSCSPNSGRWVGEAEEMPRQPRRRREETKEERMERRMREYQDAQYKKRRENVK
jgi:hypothetical protein